MVNEFRYAHLPAIVALLGAAMLRATAIFILILVFIVQNYLGTPGPAVGPAVEGATAAEAQQAADRLAATKIPVRDLYDLTAP